MLPHRRVRPRLPTALASDRACSDVLGVFFDVSSGTDVVARDTASAAMLGVECGPLDPQGITQLRVAVLAKVGDDVAFLLGEMFVVRLPTRRHCLPPCIAPQCRAGCVADSLT